MANKHDGKAAAAAAAAQANSAEDKGKWLNDVHKSLIRDKQVPAKAGTVIGKDADGKDIIAKEGDKRPMKSISFAHHYPEGATEPVMGSFLVYPDQVISAKTFSKDPANRKVKEDWNNIRLLSKHAKNPDRNYTVSLNEKDADGNWMKVTMTPDEIIAAKSECDAVYKKLHKEDQVQAPSKDAVASLPEAPDDDDFTV